MLIFAPILMTFAAAVAAGVPVLTSVSPAFMSAWDRFAAPLYDVVPADIAAVEASMRAVLSPARIEA